MMPSFLKSWNAPYKTSKPKKLNNLSVIQYNDLIVNFMLTKMIFFKIQIVRLW